MKPSTELSQNSQTKKKIVFLFETLSDELWETQLVSDPSLGLMFDLIGPCLEDVDVL